MNPGADWSIGIVHDEREALGFLRWRAPRELRRGVRAIAGKFLGHRFSRRESRAGDLHGHDSSFVLGVKVRESQRRNTQEQSHPNDELRAHDGTLSVLS